MAPSPITSDLLGPGRGLAWRGAAWRGAARAMRQLLFIARNLVNESCWKERILCGGDERPECRASEKGFQVKVWFSKRGHVVSMLGIVRKSRNVQETSGNSSTSVLNLLDKPINK